MANWIVQANPKSYFIVHYYLDDYVKNRKDVQDWWQTKNHHAEVRLGDTVFIWKAKGEPKYKAAPEYHDSAHYNKLKNLSSGIYAVAVVTKPEKYASTYQVEPESRNLGRYYAKPEGPEAHEKRMTDPAWRAQIRYEYNLVDTPLFQDKLWDHCYIDPGRIEDGLEPLWSSMLNRQTSIFPPVGEKEAKILRTLIYKHAGIRIPEKLKP